MTAQAPSSALNAAVPHCDKVGTGISAGGGGEEDGGPPALTSNAPMSVCAPTVRGNPAPRWSNDKASGFDPVSMAGVPESNACVCVGPPLLASGPNNGFCPVMLAVFVPKVNPLVTWIRLLVA